MELKNESPKTNTQNIVSPPTLLNIQQLGITMTTGADLMAHLSTSNASAAAA
jgi:hypothetical protein